MLNKQAHNMQCIDNLMNLFYEDHLWTIAIELFNHMIDTLTNKTEELIIIESDPSILTNIMEAANG